MPETGRTLNVGGTFDCVTGAEIDHEREGAPMYGAIRSYLARNND